MTQTAPVEANTLTIRELLDLPAAIDIETAARAFGIGRTTAYQLARTGRFPCQVVRAGRLMRIPTADLHRVLRISPDAEPPAN